VTTRGLLAGVLLLTVGVAGCASDTESYCATLKDQEQTLTGLARSSGEPRDGLFEESLAVFRDLRDEAPDDLRDEWDTYVFAWEGVAESFADAGVGPQDYRPGEAPPGVPAQQVRAIELAAEQLRSDRVVDAGTGIERHASDVCKVDLGL
jgi:hypothetical protein